MFTLQTRKNNRIRRVDTKGNIRTIAGRGSNSTTGCLTPSFAGDLDPTSTSPTNGFAVLATLCQPQGVAVDSSGNVYIADTGNNRIRLLPATASGKTFTDSNRTITTVVGGGLSTGGVSPLAAGLNGPRG